MEIIKESTQYTIILNNRGKKDELHVHLKLNGIKSMIYNPSPMQKQTAYNELKYKKVDDTATERLNETVLALSIHPKY